MTHSINLDDMVDQCLEQDPSLFKQLYPELNAILESCKGDPQKAESLALDLYLGLVIPGDKLNNHIHHAAKVRIASIIDDAAARHRVSRLVKLTSIIMSFCDDKRRLG